MYETFFEKVFSQIYHWFKWLRPLLTQFAYYYYRPFILYKEAGWCITKIEKDLILEHFNCQGDAYSHNIDSLNRCYSCHSLAPEDLVKRYFILTNVMKY